ncbi:TetR/AcrR family transcriptional regulator [Jannaschia ovalis]|uniref:TetR/AcrR family transcriptional regulator n=1 Tax=Jannaschia ovalis TaxID=3038773 RepID=A0ABY8LBA8_9RHOB|nr:TetR/AcrR family transcriptional regulator [Jannaschia sp. GRR-S6-38]WGH78406.1 TetR/AcrR family transcriptional regulator [Jannaschia sp. GRR-S6-38]
MTAPTTPDQTTAPPRAYHHGDLRAALLDAAEAELSERGVEGFSLRKVAARAGVSHAAPAHHFKDAGGLLTALAARGFDRLVAMQDARAVGVPEGDLRGELLAYGLAYVDFAREHTALFRLCFSSDRPDHAAPELERAGGAAYGSMTARVAALARREVEAVQPDIWACWGMIHGIADLLASGRMHSLGDLERPARERAIIALMTRVLPPASEDEAAGPS